MHPHSPRPNPLHRGVHTERPLPPHLFPPPPSPWVGSGQRCPSVPPPGRPHPGVPHTTLSPHLVFTHGVVVGLFVKWWGFFFFRWGCGVRLHLGSKVASGLFLHSIRIPPPPPSCKGLDRDKVGWWARYFTPAPFSLWACNGMAFMVFWGKICITNCMLGTTTTTSAMPPQR